MTTVVLNNFIPTHAFAPVVIHLRARRMSWNARKYNETGKQKGPL
jgi:hypothetical protein